MTNNCDDEYTVHCYDLSQDKWTTLPPLLVKWFGLGQINGKLVAVGGQKVHEKETNEPYAFDEQSQLWRQVIPPMPTARDSPGVLSLQSALIVIGGYTSSSSSSCTNTVEIFKPDTSQ